MHSLEPVRNWITAMFPTAAMPLPGSCSPRFYHGGVCTNHLRTIPWAKQPKVSTEHLPWLIMALINARSVVNKTYIIKDFFSSRDVDFLFITETWLSAGDLSPFSELLPSNCLFFNTPRLTGRGGGLASIYRDAFSCRSIGSTAVFNCSCLRWNYMSLF